MLSRTAKFVKKSASLLRSARSWGALGLLMALAISSGVGAGQTGRRAPVPEKPFPLPGRLVETGTHFEVKDSKFLNINLDSSRAINLTVESVPEMIVMRIEAAAHALSTAMTISGLNLSTTYHKYEDTHRNHVAFTTDAKGRYTWKQKLLKPHLVFIKTRESTNYIGEPGGQDCSTIGTWNAGSKTCTLTTNVNETIEIVSNGVTLDGAGHTITPASPCNGIGVYLSGISSATIRNLAVNQFSIGILLSQSNGNRLEKNVVTSSCGDGIVLDTSNSNSLISNTAINDNNGIFLQNSKSNSLTYNVVGVNSNVGLYMGITSGGNTIGSNTVELNNYGIVVNDHSNGNTITCNTVRHNRQGIGQGVGFYQGSKTSTVSANNFDDNSVHAFADGSSPNSFNGNYWRDLPPGYVSPFIFSGGSDTNPLQNPQNCLAFKHCKPVFMVDGTVVSVVTGPIDLSTGTSQPFIANPTSPPTADPHWQVTSIPTGAPNSLLGPAYSIPFSSPLWVRQPYAPVGPSPVQGVANWIAPQALSSLPAGPYAYTFANPNFAGSGTLIINGVASDDGADLYLDNNPTPIFSGSTFYWLSPLTPLSIPVGSGLHTLTARVQNTGGPSGLLVIAEFCRNPCVLDPGMTAASNTFARRITLAQTFTPTQTGSLTKVTHGLHKFALSVTNYDLLVTTTVGGVPSWTGGTYSAPNVLFKKTGLTVFSTSGVVNAVVAIASGQQPCLTAGTRYALILIPGSPSTGDMRWRGNSSAGSYPNGSAYELNGTTWTVPTIGPKDHGFKLDGLCPCP